MRLSRLAMAGTPWPFTVAVARPQEGRCTLRTVNGHCTYWDGRHPPLRRGRLTDRAAHLARRALKQPWFPWNWDHLHSATWALRRRGSSRVRDARGRLPDRLANHPDIGTHCLEELAEPGIKLDLFAGLVVDRICVTPSI